MKIDTRQPQLSYDDNGVAGITAASLEQAYFGIGMLHARHRQAQALRVWSAAQGILSTALIGAIPKAPSYGVDALAHRIEAPRLGQEAWQAMGSPKREQLQAYVDGFIAEAGRVGRPWERFFLGLMPAQSVTPAAVLSGALFMAYHSQALGQSRMEQLLLHLLQGGAAPAALRELHRPHLDGWRPEDGGDAVAYAAILGADLVIPTEGADGARAAGGSNAWATDGSRSPSGAARLWGDPHLPVNELPGQFFEVRVRLPQSYCLGGTMPGLPVVAVGRNATLAWTNTHACSQAVCSSLLTVTSAGEVVGAEAPAALRRRSASLGPWWAPWSKRQVSFWQSPWGQLLHTTSGSAMPAAGVYHAQHWASGQSGEHLAQSLEAYMGLAEAQTVQQAQTVMGRQQVFSFHMIYGDRDGAVAHQQTGQVPRRQASDRGLLVPWNPADPNTPAPPWAAVQVQLPAEGGHASQPVVGGFVASANEGRLGDGAAVLAPFAQPNYRLERITQLLQGQQRHDVTGAMQLDVVSGQAQRLTPLFLEMLDPAGPVARALAAWDFRYDANSLGADAFTQVYQSALHALAQELGGSSWHEALNTTEVSVWWAKPLDDLLADPKTWAGPKGLGLQQAVHDASYGAVQPWGASQTVQPAHPLAGLWGGEARQMRHGLLAPRQPLPGSIATIRQGNLVPNGQAKVAVAASFRFACDLATDEAYTSLPTGPRDPDRGRLLEAWHAGESHVLRAPPSFV